MTPVPGLVKQTLRPISSTTVQLASVQRLPFEKDASVDSAHLDKEFDDTNAFLNMQLRKDPRLQPDNIVVTTDHMSTCTSCTHDAGLHAALHGAAEIDIGTRTQLLVDDWTVSQVGFRRDSYGTATG